jgi:hypothetical protein
MAALRPPLYKLAVLPHLRRGTEDILRVIYVRDDAKGEEGRKG